MDIAGLAALSLGLVFTSSCKEDVVEAIITALMSRYAVYETILYHTHGPIQTSGDCNLSTTLHQQMLLFVSPVKSTTSVSLFYTCKSCMALVVKSGAVLHHVLSAILLHDGYTGQTAHCSLLVVGNYVIPAGPRVS